MNVVFLTLSRITDMNDRGIYIDLLRKFRNEGHQVYVVCPFERRFGHRTELFESEGVKVLGVKVLNIQKTHFLEKGIATLLLEHQYAHAINKYLKGIKFDLILYSTPPITLAGVVKRLKAMNPHAHSYLLLKDIFPQNAVDLGMIKEGGLLHRHFRKQECELYRLSDYIGCMSPANVDFVVKYNPGVNPEKVEIAPNSVELGGASLVDDRMAVRRQFDLPTDKPVFIYGGNLGKPQGIDYLIACMEAVKERKDCFFVIIGTGTEYAKLAQWYATNKPGNVKVMAGLPKTDYDRLVQVCDVGLIFLDRRFLIPNYPSRLLSYMEYKMPILACTDVHTDIGSIAQENGYGYWCESRHTSDFVKLVDRYVSDPASIAVMGQKGYDFLKAHYTVDVTYEAVMRHFKD